MCHCHHMRCGDGTVSPLLCWVWGHHCVTTAMGWVWGQHSVTVTIAGVGTARCHCHCVGYGDTAVSLPPWEVWGWHCVTIPALGMGTSLCHCHHSGYRDGTVLAVGTPLCPRHHAGYGAAPLSLPPPQCRYGTPWRCHPLCHLCCAPPQYGFNLVMSHPHAVTPLYLSLIQNYEPTRPVAQSPMPSTA